MRMRILAGTMCVATAAFAAGQPPMGPPAKTFEVASVRKSPPPDMRKIVAVLREGRRPGAQAARGRAHVGAFARGHPDACRRPVDL